MNRHAKYLFITYGEPGWRGVQVRGLRIAQYFNKEDVLFWNIFDSDFIKKWGFTVEEKDQGIVNPEDITFPEGLEAVIFADIPSNEFFQYSVYQAALKQKFKIIICDQIYSRKQLTEGVFAKLLNHCDLFLCNAVSFFKYLETDRVKIVPPQIEFTFTPQTKSEVLAKYKIPQGASVIFGVGYHEKVMEKIINIAEKLQQTHKNVFVIIAGSSTHKTLTRKGNYIILPFDIGDEYFKLMYCAEIVLVKFGFLQILESLALNKPTIVLGEGGFLLQSRDIVDPAYKDVLKFYPTITDDTYNYISTLLHDEHLKSEIENKVKNIHDGQLYGARQGADEIKKILSKKTVRQHEPKKLGIFMNNEIIEYAEWLQKNNSVYPLNFVVGMPTDKMAVKRIPQAIMDIQMNTLQYEYPHEVLPHSFKELYVFSKRKLDGFLDILPWYEEWVRHLENLIAKSDTLYITKQGILIFNELIKNKNAQNKVVII